MGIFGVLDTASRALLINQAGIQTTGHNIANADNPAYSRQRQIVEAELPETFQNGQLGLGIRQVTVERITDSFLLRSLIEEQTSSGSTDVQANALAQIEEVFNEQFGGGLSQALGDFYNAFEDLASSTHPTGATEREQVLYKAEAVIAELNNMDLELRQQQRAADRAIQEQVDKVNQLTQNIYELNLEIVRHENVGPANDMRDERDQLVRDLARMIDIQTFEKEDGDITVMMRSNGLNLVDGPSVNQLDTVLDTSNVFDTTFVQINYTGGGATLDVTGEIGGGELGGTLAVRDSTIPDAIRSLDTIAYNLITSVNTQHNAGYALDGTTDVDFFTDLTAAGVEDAARDITIASAILTSTDNIAAAGNAPANVGDPALPGDRENAQLLADLRTTSIDISLPGDPPGPASGPTRSLLDHTAATIADIGQQSLTMQEAKATQDRVLETLENRRDQVSGVSVDEEVVNLIRLQAAFQANARVISTVQVMLDELVAVI